MRRGRYVKGKKVGKGNIANVVSFCRRGACLQNCEEENLCLCGVVRSAACRCRAMK